MSAFGKARKQLRLEQEKPNFTPEFSSSFYDYQAKITAEYMHKPTDQVKEIIEKYIYNEWEHHFLGIKLFPYVREVLSGLKSASLKLAVMSDFPPENKLRNLGIDGFFDTMLCSEKTGALKPAPQPFLELAKSLETPPEKILYVGNNFRYDIIGASRAGFKTAFRAKKLSKKTQYDSSVKADFLFNNYRQFYNYMLN